MNIFIILVIGSFIGWIANLFIYGHGFGLRGDISAGILGAFIALFIYSTIKDFPLTMLESVGISVLGATAFLLIVDWVSVRRTRRRLL